MKEPIPAGTDLTQKIHLDKVNLNYEQPIAGLCSTNAIKISYPPQTSIGTDRARINIEQETMLMSNIRSDVTIAYPPKLNIKTKVPTLESTSTSFNHFSENHNIEIDIK